MFYLCQPPLVALSRSLWVITWSRHYDLNHNSDTGTIGEPESRLLPFELVKGPLILSSYSLENPQQP